MARKAARMLPYLCNVNRVSGSLNWETEWTPTRPLTPVHCTKHFFDGRGFVVLLISRNFLLNRTRHARCPLYWHQSTDKLCTVINPFKYNVHSIILSAVTTGEKLHFVLGVSEWWHRSRRWVDLLITEDEKERRRKIRRKEKEKEEELNKNRDTLLLLIEEEKEEEKETRRKIS